MRLLIRQATETDTGTIRVRIERFGEGGWRLSIKKRDSDDVQNGPPVRMLSKAVKMALSAAKELALTGGHEVLIEVLIEVDET